jgi:uncharacterized protein YecT (DUF1311 family)
MPWRTPCPPASRAAALAVLWLGAGAAAAGTGPAFDCTRAQGTVEKAVCADPGLAARDRALADAYRAAAARATGTLAATLRAEQRGWVKGRNDCWKADGQPTWITATWTVKTVHDCIDAQYRLRTSELQALWRLLPPTTASHACQGHPADELVVHAFASDPATLRIERGDRTATLWQVGAPADGRFEGRNVGVVRQGHAVQVEWLDVNSGKTETLDCRPR